jgi:hypothetical protein
MAEADPYSRWSISDRLQMLAFEAELARLPRSLILALWEAIDVNDTSHKPGRSAADTPLKGPP